MDEQEAQERAVLISTDPPTYRVRGRIICMRQDLDPQKKHLASLGIESCQPGDAIFDAWYATPSLSQEPPLKKK